MYIIPFVRIFALTAIIFPISFQLSGLSIAPDYTKLTFSTDPGKKDFDPVCSGPVNVTINPDLCYAAIRVTNLLSGDYNPAEYSVEFFDQAGNSLGDTIPGFYAGQTVNGVVSHQLSLFSCTVPISVYDQSPPVLHLPADTVLSCDQEPLLSVTGTATASDCTPAAVNYIDQWTETPCGNPKIKILRIWTAVDQLGLSTVDTQHIEIVQATAADFLFPEDRDYTCREYLADPDLIKPLDSGAGLPTLVGNPRCGLIYTYQDQNIPLCGDPETSFIILRKWTVLEACGNEIFVEDGAGNDNVQFIRVMDKTAPEIQPVVQDLRADIRKEDNGLETCSSQGFIPPPVILDECNTVSVRIFTPIGELEYVNGQDASQGGYIPAPGLPLGGPHRLFYEAVDACGNMSTSAAFVQVVDEAEPVLLCDQQVIVSLSTEGNGRLEPFMIDEGTTDNCCLDKMQVKWLDEPVISFRDRIEIYCAADPRKAVLRVWDCQGNYNDCETTVVTQDPVPASILVAPPQMLEVNCGQDRAVFSDAQHQAPVFEDNCPQNVQFSVRDSINECGTADLYREWTLQDHPDHELLRVGQLIRFIDQEAPQILVEIPDLICDADGDCLADLVLTFEVFDNCSETLTLIHQISLNGGAVEDDPFGQLVTGIDGVTLQGAYPLGEHQIFLTATDPCGNISERSLSLLVSDCTPPDLTCLDDPVFVIGEDQQIVLTPEDLVENVSDACHEVTLSFPETGLDNIIYDCDSLGMREVNVWATDLDNNRSNCTLHIIISKEGPGCEPLGRLSGRIVTENGRGVGQVQVHLNGPDTLRTVTDAEGYYLFEGVPMDTDYELQPVKDINPVNGVSVLDIIRISRHILGLDYMTSPYQIIAADVNNSAGVTTIDIIAARRVILGLSEYFSGNNRSWRFIPAGYEFMKPERPLEERVPESVNFKLINEETVVDFIGVKYGDVNGSADPQH